MVMFYQKCNTYLVPIIEPVLLYMLWVYCYSTCLCMHYVFCCCPSWL